VCSHCAAAAAACCLLRLLILLLLLLLLLLLQAVMWGTGASPCARGMQALQPVLHKRTLQHAGIRSRPETAACWKPQLAADYAGVFQGVRGTCLTRAPATVAVCGCADCMCRDSPTCPTDVVTIWLVGFAAWLPLCVDTTWASPATHVQLSRSRCGMICIEAWCSCSCFAFDTN
jgi:hypothetical protein